MREKQSLSEMRMNLTLTRRRQKKTSAPVLTRFRKLEDEETLDVDRRLEYVDEAR